VAIAAWSAVNVIPKIAHPPAIAFTFYRLWMGAAVMLAAVAVTGRRLT